MRKTISFLLTVLICLSALAFSALARSPDNQNPAAAAATVVGDTTPESVFPNLFDGERNFAVRQPRKPPKISLRDGQDFYDSTTIDAFRGFDKPARAKIYLFKSLNCIPSQKI